MTTPSIVSFKNKNLLVGSSATSHVVMNAKNTIFEAKRLIGKRFSDPSIANDIKIWPFKVVSSEDADDKPIIIVEFKGEERRFECE